MFADSSAGFFYLEMMRRRRQNAIDNAQKHIFKPGEGNIFTFKTAEEAEIFKQEWMKKRKGDMVWSRSI